MSQKITKFFGYDSPLSQYRYCSFEVLGVKFCSLKMFYEFMKASKFNDQAAKDAILKTTKGGEHHEIGKKIKGFKADEWAKVAEDYVKTGCRSKFEQNAGLRKYLLKTENNLLVDCSAGDFLLGCGLMMDNPDVKDPTKWPGKNIHGKAMMELRDSFRNDPKYADEIKNL